MDANFLSDAKDNLSLAVKSDILENMKKWYAAFGWTIEEEYPDKLYIDITHLTLTRPHKITHKDRLQLLQVRFEMLVNFIARTQRRARIYTGVISAILFLLGAAIIVCGILLCAMTSDVFYFVCGVVIGIAGVLFWVLSAVLSTQMYEYYVGKVNVYVDILEDNIKEIISEAAKLTGYKDGNKEQ